MISTGPHLLAEGTGNEPPDAVGLSASCFHDLGQRRAALPFQESHNGDGLAALAGATHGLDLAKVSNGVAVVAAASSGLANALMLFPASMVNVFM